MNEDTAQINVVAAAKLCRAHGAVGRLVDNRTAMLITDGHSVYSGDVWGKVRVYSDGTVNAQAVLSALGY